MGRAALADARRGLSGHRIALALWLGSGIAAVAWLIWGPKGEAVQVLSLPWSRDIEIERQVEVTDSGWCTQLPDGARVLDRRRLPDPVSDKDAEHCRYAARQWRPVYSIKASGDGPWPAPHWPELSQAADERAGQRHERYEVVFGNERGQRWTCRLNAPGWAALHSGQRLRLRVDRFGVADCASVPGVASTQAASAP